MIARKTIAALIAVLFTVNAWAATYYVKTGGNDSATGLSDAAAWATISKVTTSTAAGDTVYFRRGDTFVGAIVAKSNMTFDAYGTGARPVINGNGLATPLTTSSTGTVTARSLNLVNSSARNINNNGGTNITIDDCVLDSSTTDGINQAGTASITITDSFISNSGAAAGHGINITAGSAVISGTTVTGSKGNGFRVINAGTMTATDCESWGNTVNGFYGTNTSTMTCTNCTAHNNAEDGFSGNLFHAVNCWYCLAYDNGTAASATAGDGFTAHDNMTLNVRYSIAYGNTKSGIAVTGAASGVIYNNTFYDNYEATTEDDFGIWLNSTGTWTVNNNITKNHRSEILITSTAVSGGATIVSDYNLFDDSRGGSAFHYNGTDYGFAAYQAAASQDTHSLNTNPRFTGILGLDFSLDSKSRAIDSGTNLSLVLDFYGNTVPRHGGQDIGAIEYQSSFVHGWSGNSTNVHGRNGLGDTNVYRP